MENLTIAQGKAWHVLRYTRSFHNTVAQNRSRQTVKCSSIHILNLEPASARTMCMLSLIYKLTGYGWQLRRTGGRGCSKKGHVSFCHIIIGLLFVVVVLYNMALLRTYHMMVV